MANEIITKGSGDMKEAGIPKQMVGFSVGSEVFCVDILKVQEIIRMVKITHMPNAPEYVEGVINLRGKVIPVIDFRKRMHMNVCDDSNENERRIVVATFGGNAIGMIVDKVSSVMKIAPEQITETSEIIKGVDSECLMGVGRIGEQLIVLLDIDKMFSNGEIHSLPQAA